jgi:hypothetical protein
MTDRLREILRSNVNFKVTDITIGQALGHIKTHKVEFFDATLFEECKSWSLNRSNFMHSLGQITGVENITWLQRLSKARSVAEDGVKLVNRLSKEARKHAL